MPIEDNIDELANEILKTAEYLDKGVDGELSVLLSDVYNLLYKGGTRRTPFKNRTGNLRRSFSGVRIEENAFIIQMMYYGYFLSFGVDGFKRNGAFGIPAEVAGAFNEPVGYRFGSKHNPKKVPGIDAFDFYPKDIEQRLINIYNKEFGNG